MHGQVRFSVPLGHHNKISLTEWLTNNRQMFLIVLEAGSVVELDLGDGGYKSACMCINQLRLKIITVSAEFSSFAFEPHCSL